MINLIGKSLALLQVALSIMLMTFAAALYINAVDFGWKVPARAFIESENRKPGDNLAIPSHFDKRDAGLRRVARLKQDALIRLGTAQTSFLEVEPFLSENHLKGEAELARLEEGEGELKVKDIKFDDQGNLALEAGTSRQLGFPILEDVIPGVKMSYVSYAAMLRKHEGDIAAVQKETEDILVKEGKLTRRMSGEMDKEGKLVRDNGAVKEPGWYYVLEVEAKMQQELKKEMEYLQPLWLKELMDAQLLVSRREILLRRLRELGDNSYLSQSEFLRKLD